MTLEDSLKVERKKWIEEGRAIAKLENVSKLAANGRYSAEEACEILEVPFEDYEKYLEENDLN